ncbi:hypothetical protein J6590_073445 [Homalodisca vitripennis]|nr:hypothetical protein J6590_073445 [Homalodisca vitripennis]
MRRHSLPTNSCSTSLSIVSLLSRLIAYSNALQCPTFYTWDIRCPQTRVLPRSQQSFLYCLDLLPIALPLVLSPETFVAHKLVFYLVDNRLVTSRLIAYSIAPRFITGTFVVIFAVSATFSTDVTLSSSSPVSSTSSLVWYALAYWELSYRYREHHSSSLDSPDETQIVQNEQLKEV